MATRRQCDGFTKSCCLPKQFGTFLFTSYCIREEKNARCHRWSHEEKTKTTRSDKVASRWPHEGQDGLTNSIRKLTFARSSGNFLTCKRFCAAHEVAAGAWESSPATIRWLKMPSRMARCFHDQSRMWTFLPSCFYLVSTSGQCDASITGKGYIKAFYRLNFRIQT